MDEQFGTANINSLWLQNVYENLKNLEMLERIAKEGCNSVMEYLGIPMDQRITLLADTQYKNLRFIVTEMSLLLTDLTPVMDQTKLKIFRQMLSKIEEVITKRQLFVNENYSAKKKGIVQSSVTEFFHQTLKFLCNLRIKIIQENAQLLYIKEDDRKGWPETS